MAGKSPVVAGAAQRRALTALGQSSDRGEADRARAVLLTLSGWTSGRIAEAFGVREDTVRFWRSAFMTGGVAALRTRVAPGPAPVKAERALEVARDLLGAPVADRPNWTLPRLAEEIAQRSGVRISPSRLSVVLRQKGGSAGGDPGTRCPSTSSGGRQDAAAVARARRRLRRLKARAKAGAIVLLFGDESEALTHPYLAHVWAKKGADLRVPAPGQASKVAILGVLDRGRSELVVHTSASKRSSDFLALLADLDRRYGPRPGVAMRPVVLVLDNGPIHISKATRAALAARAHWLKVEWLPKYAPELNDIERVWRDLKRHHLAHKTFTGPEDLTKAIREAVMTLNTERRHNLLATPQSAA